MTSFVIGTLMVFIIEMSLSWGLFGDNIWTIIVMLRVFGTLFDMAIEHQLQDAILVAPVSCAVGFAQGLVTFGSPDFYAFILAYFVEVALAILERVYIDESLDMIFTFIGLIISFIFQIGLRYTPRYVKVNLGIIEKSEEERRKSSAQLAALGKREMEGVAESDDTDSVEPILGSFGSVCNDSMLLYFMPYFIYLFMQYRSQIGVPSGYGIRQSDMFIYLIYQIFLITFQPIVDILIHSHLELYHGWKVYEYLVYSRYRFLQRETRWKGMEASLDECIDEGMRRLDQMCFSSQYFMMLTIQTTGIIYVMMAYECWLRSAYSPFTDEGFIFLTAYMVGAYLLIEFLFFQGAIFFGLWRIKHENTSWHIVQQDEDELDIPGWEDVKGASHEAYLMNQRITSDTFRFKFLNYNRSWLINQLPSLLTPRTLRRSRPYLINQFARIINARRGDITDDDEVDLSKQFGPVALTNPSRNIIRWWLGKAKRRLKLRSVVDALIRKARGGECEQCLSRKQLQVEYEIDVDQMAQMYDNTFPGDEEVDQVQWKTFWMNNQRYHTICLACVTKRKEIETQNALAGLYDDDLLNDKQEEYPDWGPIFLSAASKAILLNWYRKAQRLRAGKKGAKKRVKEVKQISDDEGDEIPAEWVKNLKSISDSTKTIAIKWMRTARARLQQRKGKGVSVREVEIEELTENFKSGKKSKNLRK